MVLKHTGTPSVCEAAALLASGNNTLVIPKVSIEGAVTIAVARAVFDEAPKHAGRLYLVGTGPGSLDQMTFKSREIIDECDLIVGYHPYIAQIQPLLGNQEIIATGMGSEVERVHEAVLQAASGRKVALISGGDTGIYGMAALAGEILGNQPGNDIVMEVVPGVTALVAAAARLGSPVSVDFAVISLSDYLIPIERIRQRLELAAQGDFVIVLYNPKSKKRVRHLAEARDIIMRFRSPVTPVGYVTDAFRKNEETVITDLDHMLDYEAGMNTIIIIGNSTTVVSGNRMITPRGYRTKYELGIGGAADKGGKRTV
jgi:precorrin-3B C17-methyltransferase